ncbi:hypothetical protein M467_07685 [Exiguobacterium chiriqhucha RW-2]|uniref:Uncharacterized protein n=1 Tax=Exiguobacterium chiriqhucha RW-2 TaxID=1345023 RepID=U1LIA5_9BACL|nr:hypothetical protein M467_07685 [Exiguobacterium chiriqhucha RW-2]
MHAVPAAGYEWGNSLITFFSGVTSSKRDRLGEAIRSLQV